MDKRSNIKKQIKLTKRDSSLIRQLFNITKPLKKSPSVNKINTVDQSVIDTIKKQMPLPAISNRKMWKVQLKPLNFEKYHKHHKKPLYRTCYRFFIHESHLAFLDSLNHIIRIQTNFRSYASKKKYYNREKDIIQEKGINAILVIQSKTRQFLQFIHFKKKLLSDTIISQRKKNFLRIESQMKMFYIQNQKNKQLIYNDIVRRRTKSAIKLQKIFRGMVIYSKVQDFKKRIRSNYYLFYPFHAKNISLKVYSYMNDSTNHKTFVYHYEYFQFLKCFVLFVPYSSLASGKYRCQFIVDGVVTCDGRYPHIEFSDGLFYNMIDFRRPYELVIKDKIDFNELDETRTDEINQIEVDLGNLSSNCFFEGIKKFKCTEDYLTLRIDLYGKKHMSKMEEIRNEPFSKMELKFDN